MGYIMIERSVYDAMVLVLYESRELLVKSVNKLSGNLRQEWIDNHSAQAILCRSQRSMAMLRTEGKIGYTLIEGMVFYPANEIGKLLINNYERYD